MANFGFNFQLPDINPEDLTNQKSILAIKNQLYALQEQLKYTFGNLNVADNFGSSLSLGGKNNTSGILEIKNERGNVMILLNKQGITMADGTDIFGASGLRSVLQYNTGEWARIGYQYGVESERSWRAILPLKVYIPENYTILKAEIILYHAANQIEAFHLNQDEPIRMEFYGYARNIRLYYDTDFDRYYRRSYVGSEITDMYSEATAQEILGAFGENGFTPTQPSAENLRVQSVTSINIAKSLKPGINNLLIKTGDNIPDYIGDLGGLDSYMEEHSGVGYAIINIVGYLK